MAVIYGTRAGIGGLGLQAATAIQGLAIQGKVTALGPGRSNPWPLAGSVPPATWVDSPPFRPSWFARNVTHRFRAGRFILSHDRRVGQWAAGRLPDVRPNAVYAFTQVAHESLTWARKNGIPSLLDNPNGHIRGFAEVFHAEWAKLVGGHYHGHPSRQMIERVEREYALADRIRVSSEWAKRSMVARGIPATKIVVYPQIVNCLRFRPPDSAPAPHGPLRICYVGSLDVRKGFVYLLRAIRRVGLNRARLEIVGATGNRGARKLFARERSGLNVEAAAGDPVPAYHRAELFVLPSLEDGFGFVAAEAMACGLPVIVTDQCGAAEWVRPGVTGWIVSAGRADSIADAIESAIGRRSELRAMGRAARRTVELGHQSCALPLDSIILRDCPPQTA